ncbi:CD3337/EF1877 family mobilome membrane protein [Lacticaseibacillus paracasei]|uniref:CD3337/EF1877 family mobilome membrane protein n=1 Tax=Lacticaseibacillus paracasei TaxID=1597 RepID=UPI0008DC9E42|nr:conjugal transfer protein [Lacticaseibacillus paracasei]OHY46778.1 conjugal transfer protein [Lacticaseibacillus paracasei]
MTKANRRRLLLFLGVVAAFMLVLMLAGGQPVHAAGLVDDQSGGSNEYSKYPLSHYQLDYFVDTSWDWLPWNWGDGIGKSVSYGLYAITNFLWTLSVYLSNAAGYLIQQAYSLDFIKDTSDAIGKNMQLLAGVSKDGFTTDGFYPGLLLMITLVVGIYVAYTGIIKRETSKAISAFVNFVVIFITSASFIAYAPDYVSKINEFSSDISTSALNTGSKMIMGTDTATDKSGVDAIRDTLFEIQVKQPWTLLQFGDSDADTVGKDRVNTLMKTDPFGDKGKTRTDVVKAEIEDNDNENLSPTMTINRLGTTTFVVLFNMAITLFVFFLTAMMLFSQILFIIYATFLPVSFLLAMLPSFNGLMKQNIMKLFNTIMTRVGVTLVITMAFSLSAMVYGLSATSPFFLVAFLQVTIFAGIWMKLGDLMGMMQLHSSDAQQGAQRFSRRGNRMLRQFVGSAMGGAMAGRFLSWGYGKGRGTPQLPTGTQREQTADATKPQQPKKPRSQRLGEKLADVSDVGNKLKDKTERGLDQVKDAPTNVLYGLHRGKQLTKEAAETAKDSFKGRREANQQERDKQLEQRRKQMQERKLAIKPKADPEKPKPTATKPPVEPTRKPTTATPTKPKPEQADTSGQPKRAATKPTSTRPPRPATKPQSEPTITPHQELTPSTDRPKKPLTLVSEKPAKPRNPKPQRIKKAKGHKKR